MRPDAESDGGRTKGEAMDDFPEFMKRPANRIATSSQATPGVEGYVFDGADGSQMAFWTSHETANSTPHVHDYEEWFVVVQGCYTLIIDAKRIPVRAGEEYVIPRGVRHGGRTVGRHANDSCFWRTASRTGTFIANRTEVVSQSRHYVGGQARHIPAVVAETQKMRREKSTKARTAAQ
jgi:mannose-6-phosphate isomerase-like protein (cupin superfamily)